MGVRSGPALAAAPASALTILHCRHEGLDTDDVHDEIVGQDMQGYLGGHARRATASPDQFQVLRPLCTTKSA
jgi:hypothetical protein